jgi:phage-related protein
MSLQNHKPIVLLSRGIHSPPFGDQARRKAGFLLRMLQRGELLYMPDSKAMPSIGPRVHELRIIDSPAGVSWRIIYRIDLDSILIPEIFPKKTQKTPDDVIWRCKARFKKYDRQGL